MAQLRYNPVAAPNFGSSLAAGNQAADSVGRGLQALNKFFADQGQQAADNFELDRQANTDRAAAALMEAARGADAINNLSTVKQSLIDEFASSGSAIDIGRLNGIEQGLFEALQQQSNADRTFDRGVAQDKATADYRASQLNLAERTLNETIRKNVVDDVLSAQPKPTEIDTSVQEILNDKGQPVKVLLNNQTGAVIKTIGKVQGKDSKANKKNAPLGLTQTRSQAIEAGKPFPDDWNAAQREASTLATSEIAKAQVALDTINGIGAEDIANAGGWSSIGGALTPSTAASVQKFNTLGSQQFLANIAAMKGLGALSNAEGSKVTAAANALIDPETNTMKTGLAEDFVAGELTKIQEAYSKMLVLNRFVEENGYESTESQAVELYSQAGIGQSTGNTPQRSPEQGATQARQAQSGTPNYSNLWD